LGTLDRTLQVFRELLAAKQPADLGEADAAIWSYLSSVDGLHAQTAALERLCHEVNQLDSTSLFMPRLRDDLRRHRERLSK
jgi:hypothetical protein